MYSINKIDGSESSTAKGVNIATEFHEFKDVLFNKKNIRHKMKRIQANIKQELMKLIKHLYHVLMIKDLYQMMEFILQLIFIKIVTKNVIMKMKMKIIRIIMIMIMIMIIIMKNENENDNDNEE